MPRKIPEPKLTSAQKVSALEQSRIHFGSSALSPARPSST